MCCLLPSVLLPSSPLLVSGVFFWGANTDDTYNNQGSTILQIKSWRVFFWTCLHENEECESNFLRPLVEREAAGIWLKHLFVFLLANVLFAGILIFLLQLYGTEGMLQIKNLTSSKEHTSPADFHARSFRLRSSQGEKWNDSFWLNLTDGFMWDLLRYCKMC